MGFWDREVDNSFDAMFDLNHDGKIDLMEEDLQFDFVERESRGLDPWDSFGGDRIADEDRDEMDDELEASEMDEGDFDDFDF